MNPDVPPPDAVEQVERLFLKHQAVVRAFTCSLLSDFSLADDVLHETFLTVRRKAQSYRPGSNFVAWACTVARFKVLEALRASGKRCALSEEAMDALGASEDAIPFDPRLDVLDECLGKLAPHARRLVELRYVGGSMPEEIARLMEWTPGAVNVALTRARQLLRECVETTAPQVESEPQIS
ncbi:MAG: sigma-70 family RNA polymerase sigma factor [Verrucomicrobiota bacterium]